MTIAQHRALERLKHRQRKQILPGIYLLLYIEIVLFFFSH